MHFGPSAGSSSPTGPRRSRARWACRAAWSRSSPPPPPPSSTSPSARPRRPGPSSTTRRWPPCRTRSPRRAWSALCRFVDRPLEHVLAPDGPAPRLVALCADVRDPGNAGTVIRTADAAGADAVVLAGHSVDAYNPKTVRATVGSLFHLPVALEPDPATAVTRAAGGRADRARRRRDRRARARRGHRRRAAGRPHRLALRQRGLGPAAGAGRARRPPGRDPDPRPRREPQPLHRRRRLPLRQRPRAAHRRRLRRPAGRHDDPDRPAQRGGSRPALVAPGQRHVVRRAPRLRAGLRGALARLRPGPLRRARRVVRPGGRRRRGAGQLPRADRAAACGRTAPPQDRDAAPAPSGPLAAAPAVPRARRRGRPGRAGRSRAAGPGRGRDRRAPFLGSRRPSAPPGRGRAVHLARRRRRRPRRRPDRGLGRPRGRGRVVHPRRLRQPPHGRPAGLGRAGDEHAQAAGRVLRRDRPAPGVRLAARASRPCTVR